MPYSSLIFDDEIEQIIKFLQPKRILDIGAGAGKYGETIKRISEGINTTALEIEKEYIKKFKLKEKYSRVLNISADELIHPEYYNDNFDLVIMGDVIEHMKKSVGVDLINFLVYRSKWIILKFPLKYIQNSVDGYESEAHISAWSSEDFRGFDKTKTYSKNGICLVLLKGYLEKKHTLKEIKNIIELK